MEKKEEGEDVAKVEEQALHRHEEEKDGGDPLRKDEDEEGFQWPRERVCHTHERAIPIQETVETLDITEEGE